MWFTIALWVASTIATIALAPRPPKPKAAGLGDFQLPTADPSRPIPVVFGTVLCKGPNVVWYGDLRTSSIKKGSKLTGRTTVGYRYYLGMHLVLCYGPVDAVQELQVGDRRAWQGELTNNVSINVNAAGLFGGEGREGGISGQLDIAFGGPAQSRNSYLINQLGQDIPAFRGVLSLIARQMYIGTSAYPKHWAVRVRRTETLTSGRPQWYLSRADINGQANPAHILRECLTDGEWGLGYPEADLDDAAWRAAADTLYAEQFGLMLQWDSQGTIEEFVGEVLRHINGSLLQDPATGLFMLALIRDGAESVLTLNPSNCRVTDYRRESWGETINAISVQWTDPETGQVQTVEAHDPANANIQGGMIAQTVQYLGVATAELASRLAARDLAQLSRPKASVEIEATRVAYQVRVGQVVTLDWPDLGITGMQCRVVDASYGDLDSGAVRLSLVEDIFSAGQTLFATPPPTGWTPPTQGPRPVQLQRLIEIPYWTWVRDLLEWGQRPADDLAGVLLAAAQPAGAINYTLQTRRANGTFTDAADGDFCAGGQLAAGIGPEETSIILDTGALDLDTIELDTYGQLGEELVAIRAVDVAQRVLQIDRGVLDTVPTKHPAGTQFLALEDRYAADPDTYAAGDTIEARAITAASLGTLDPATAPITVTQLNGRAARPYPPARLRINGAAYPADVTGPVTVSWVHRDRTQQLEALVGQAAGSIGPEPGTSYRIRLLDADTSAELLAQSTNGSQVTLVTEQLAGPVVLELWSERDGHDSWQRHRHTFTLHAPQPEAG